MKYYLHDTNSFNDEKITELYIKYGYEGLGLFYTALERLAQQEQPIKTEVLKKQLKVGKRLEKQWKFMESLGLISSTNGESFNEKLLNNSEKYLVKKEKNRKRVAKFRENMKNVMCTEKPCNAYVTPSNITKDKISKDNIITTLQSTDCGDEINKILNLFYEINPMFNFGNKTQRKAVEEMLKKFGYENLSLMIEKAILLNSEKYAPTTTTPLEFKNNFAKIQAFFDKEKGSEIPII